MRSKGIYIELHVPDFDIVKKFYEKLGFSVVWEHKPDQKKGYLVMQRKNSILCFWPGNEKVYEQSYFKQFPQNTTRGYGVEIVIPIENIRAFYGQTKTFANIVDHLQTQPWGLKDFRIIDPFGYYLRFTEPHDVLDPKFAIK